MSFLYPFKTFGIFGISLMFLLLLKALFLIALYVQSQVLPHLPHPLVVGAVAEVGVKVGLALETREVRDGGVRVVVGNQLLVEVNPAVDGGDVERGVAGGGLHVGTHVVLPANISKSRLSTSREKKVLSPIFHCEIFISSHRHLQKIC